MYLTLLVCYAHVISLAGKVLEFTVFYSFVISYKGHL